MDLIATCVVYIQLNVKADLNVTFKLHSIFFESNITMGPHHPLPDEKKLFFQSQWLIISQNKISFISYAPCFFFFFFTFLKNITFFKESDLLHPERKDTLSMLTCDPRWVQVNMVCDSPNIEIMI